MTGLEIALLIGATRLLMKVLQPNSSPTVSTTQFQDKPPEKKISFVGRTGAGKSSTANALLGYPAFPVGSVHGTTTKVITKGFHSEYVLEDTPGLLDAIDYSQMILDSIKSSDLVIYTTTGQLYRRELEILQDIHVKQQMWDRASNSLGKRKLVLYVNQQDVREVTKPSSVRIQEENAIRAQVSAWIAADKVFFGAAAPARNGQTQLPQIENLRSFVHSHIT